MSRVTTAAFVLGSTAMMLSACMVGEDDDEDDALSIQAGGAAYTPDNVIRVANVNIYKGSFGEEKDLDGRNFLLFLARQQYVPDIFTVQNLDHSGNGFHDCRDVADKLEKYLRPKTVNYAVYNPSARGGSCVIYRTGRFDRVGETGGLGAWNGDGCSKQGMQSVGVRLRDTKKNKTISVVSVHMPGDCTKKNTEEIRQWANATSSDIRIIAGDFNTNTTAGFGSIPAMREALESNGYRVADLWGPLDWIWRKGQSAVASSKRVEFAEAMGAGYPSPGMRYSDHRGGFEDLTY
jgi:hypothetical protein